MSTRFGRWVVASGLAVIGAPVLAAAAIAPLQLSWVLGDGSVRPIELRFSGDGSVVHFTTGDIFLFGDGSVRTACDDNACDGSVRIEGSYDVDPFIHYDVSVADVGAPSTFSFFFQTPTLGGPWNTAVHQLSGTFQSPVSGLSARAGYGVDVPSLADDADLTLGPAECATPAGCGALDSVSKTGSFPQGVLSATLAFTGSGSGATYTFNGAIDLFNARVDEPVPLALLAASLGLMAALRRRTT